MKKLFTLLTLLVAIVTGAWAEDGSITDKYTTRTLSGNETTSNWAFNVVTGSAVDVKAETVDNEMVLVATSSAKIKMQTSKYVSFNTGTEVYIPVPSGSAGTVSITMYSTNDSRYFQLYTNGTIGTEGQRLYSKLNAGGITSDGKKGPQSFSFTSNDITTYQGNTYLHFKSEIGEMKVSSFTIALTTGTYAKGPQITTQPQSASYVTGQTIAALTVAATPATATFQWYSCDDTNKTNAEPIEGETSSSYTPSAAGFYYVAVTDGGVTVNSDVAKITISDAEAPEISVSGAPAEAVKVGTEVILTAEATGTPTPTITWYDSNNQSVATIEGTQLAYTVPTNEAGTYTFYAKASNGVEPDATSATQTIVVKAQVATPTITPNGAYFEESQEVTLACTDADATIQYSTDGGATWINYTEAFTVTATTTVQAKAVKDGSIDSEVATATFTLVELVAQTDVTAAATWDWSKFGTNEIKLTESTTPAKNAYFVLQNAVKYGLCSSIGSEFGDATQLNVSGEYVVRDGKYFQGGFVKFNTTVPGVLSVTYANTGNRTDESDRRFLNVNGTNYGEGTLSSKTTTTTSDIYVSAGEVTIKGVLKGDGTDQYLRIYSISFTPYEGIVLDETGGNASVISANAGQTLNVHVSRNLSASYYNTLYLPFAMSAAQITAAFGEGAQVAVFTGEVKGTAFQFGNLEDGEGMAAYTGYIVKPAADVNGFDVENATIATTIPTATTAWVMAGTLDLFENNANNGDIYYFTTAGKMKKLSETGKIKGLRAFMTTNSTAATVLESIASNAGITYGGGGSGQARARDTFYISIEGDVVTGLNAIDNGDLTIDNDAPAYNLAGQKVGKAYKGIVIINGKKVVK